MPGFMDWNGRKTATNSGQYQSGGFWATPVGWFVYTLDLADPALADQDGDRDGASFPGARRV